MLHLEKHLFFSKITANTELPLHEALPNPVVQRNLSTTYSSAYKGSSPFDLDGLGEDRLS